jgi:protein-S-isoprenylcysteine O-methyltransferase Ste14
MKKFSFKSILALLIGFVNQEMITYSSIVTRIFVGIFLIALGMNIWLHSITGVLIVVPILFGLFCLDLYFIQKRSKELQSKREAK